MCGLCVFLSYVFFRSNCASACVPRDDVILIHNILIHGLQRVGCTYHRKAPRTGSPDQINTMSPPSPVHQTDATIVTDDPRTNWRPWQVPDP